MLVKTVIVYLQFLGRGPEGSNVRFDKIRTYEAAIRERCDLERQLSTPSESPLSLRRD